MKGYLSVASGDGGKLPIDGRIELYRDSGDGTTIIAETPSDIIDLGIGDVTVSRKKEGLAPVVVVPQDQTIEIRNQANSNGVTVESQGTTHDVPQGHLQTVSNDATITIGYQTSFHLETVSEARVENNVVHRGDGDVVMGDSIDRSTTVEDSVVNRSDIADGSDSGRVETQSPEEVAAAANAQSSSTQQFCPQCGEEISSDAAFCPYCGASLPQE